MPKPKASAQPALRKTAPVPSYAELTDFGGEAFAAAMNSSAALSAGLEAIGREVAQYAQTTFEHVGEAARSLLAARTFEDVVRLQTAYANRSYEGLLARSAKLSELGCTLFGASVGAWGDRAKS